MEDIVESREHEVSCEECRLQPSCLSGGIAAEYLKRMEDLVDTRRRVKRSEHLFRAGDEFKNIYAIRSGFFKTSLVDVEGREQVTGFFMGGELLGMDGLSRGRCESSAIALEDSDVCAMPYILIEKIGREVPMLQRRLQSLLAREINRDHGIMLLLGSMGGEARLAAFLLNLSRRFSLRGYSGSDFILRMTRQEIGSYLGLKLETVSRLFTAFHKRGLLEVRHKQVRIVDVDGLSRVLALRD